MSSSVDNTCVVCFKNVEIYSIGVCDHPVCYECSTRMRVLCLQNECPICRQDMPKVIFTKNVRPYKEVANHTYPTDKQYKICFDSASIQNSYQKLLDHGCQVCGGNKVYKSFQHLKSHVQKEHELFFCDLCVDNLKIFTFERRVYNRQQLALHKRKGDPDDKSHKGHPLCEFCDDRYMDNDELFRHLRKDHLYCHFCDADGLHQYYSSYDFLREHFRKEHFLCEEGSCYDEKFTSAFRTEIDLKAHRASSHSRGMGKAAAKQARTLELEFTLAPRPRERPERGHRGIDRAGSSSLGTGTRPGASSFNHDCNHAGACNCLKDDVVTSSAAESAVAPRSSSHVASQPCLSLSDFPSLGGAPSSGIAPVHHNSGRGRGAGVTIRALAGGRPPLSITDENFPALSEPAAPQSQVWLSVNSRGSNDRSSNNPTNFSIHVNSRQRGSGSTAAAPRVTSQNIRMRTPVPSSSRPVDSEDANFPALRPLEVYRGTSADQWIASASAVDLGPSQVRSKVNLLSSNEAAQLMNNKAPAPQKPQNFVIEQDFPSLGPSQQPTQLALKKGSQRKASSVTIPMSNTWSQSAREDSAGKSSDSEAPVSTATATKSKKKKKKSKGAVMNDHEKHQNDSNKVLSEQTASNTNAELSKKKKKQQPVTKSQQKGHANKGEDSDNLDSLSSKTSVANQENREPYNNGNERKRSELQIDNLQLNDSPADTTERLLSILRGENYVPKSNPDPTVNPPPGFERTEGIVTNKPTAPPPGFTVKLNSVARPPSNSLTFTNSSGESYSIIPNASSSQYVQPPDFQRRNAALMAHVVNTLRDPSLQEEFRQMSILFRQGKLSARSYYEHCLGLMGERAFDDFFPEMLVLLPEIERQQDLLTVYRQSNIGKDQPLRFEVCATCQQVLAPSDLRFHLSTHTLENHFPALSTSDTPPASAWSRK